MRGFVVASLLLSSIALAQAPTRLGYEGLLLRSDGTPEQGVVAVQFALFDVPVGGTARWSEMQQLGLSNGLCSTFLGEQTPLGPDLFDGAERYLQLSVGGVALSPRQRINSVAYALKAAVARDVSGGLVDASQVRVGGVTVIDSSGRLAGPAALEAGSGVALQGGMSNARGNVVTTHPTAVNLYPRVVLGADGLPVLVSGSASASVSVQRCLDSACTSVAPRVRPDVSSAQVARLSAALGLDGLLVIAYRAGTVLKVTKCGDASCTAAAATVTTVDATADVGESVSMAIGLDGNPIISYEDVTNRDLKVLKCGSPSCASLASNVVSVVEAATDALAFGTSIAIGLDGLPVIAYNNQTISTLKVARCGNAACSSAGGYIINTVEGSSLQYISMTIGADGRPLIVGLDRTTAALELTRCGARDCGAAGGYTNVTLPAVASDVRTISMATGADGLVTVASSDSANQLVRFTKCLTAACTAVESLSFSLGSGEEPSIVMGADGLPFIVFEGPSYLTTVKCANAFCLNNWSRR